MTLLVTGRAIGLISGQAMSAPTPTNSPVPRLPPFRILSNSAISASVHQELTKRHDNGLSAILDGRDGRPRCDLNCGTSGSARFQTAPGLGPRRAPPPGRLWWRMG